MAFTDQEKQLIVYGKQNGKTADEITTALAKLRAGIAPTAAPEPQPNSTAKDLAIGAAKGAGDTIKTVGDAAASAIPTHVAGPILGSLPPVRDKIDSFIQPIKSFLQSHFGLTDENLKADNTAQKVGKGLEIGAELVSPFVASRFARLAEKGATLGKDLVQKAPSIPSAKIGSSIKTGVDAAADFIKNPRLTLAKKNVTPQFQASTERLFLQGTKDVKDPATVYENYLTQSKKALGDIKADPAIASVGNSIGDAFKQVVTKRREVGAVMGDELKKVGAIKTSIADAYTNLETALKEADLTYSSKAKSLVAGNASKMTNEDTALLNQYIAELNKLGAEPTVAQIDATLSRTQGLVDNFKSARGITQTTNGERLIKQSQNALREQLDPAKSGNKALAAYATARKAYSELSNFIDDGAGYLGKITQSGDFAKDASIAKSAVQSILNNGKKDFLIELEKLTGYPALDDSVLALQAMKDAGDFRGLSLLQTLSQGSIPASQHGAVQKIIDYALSKAGQAVAGTPEEQTRVFLSALKEAAQKAPLQ
jgi:hypothetical protein